MVRIDKKNLYKTIIAINITLSIESPILPSMVHYFNDKYVVPLSMNPNSKIILKNG